MSLKKPITTIGELRKFIREVAEILEMEMMLNASFQILQIAEEFHDFLLKLIPVLDTNSTRKERLIELGLSDETVLNEQAKKIVDEAQQMILSHDFEALEMRHGGFGFLVRVMSLSEDPNALHSHKCSGCGNVWEHANLCGGSESAHTCSNCGHVEWARH